MRWSLALGLGCLFYGATTLVILYLLSAWPDVHRTMQGWTFVVFLVFVTFMLVRGATEAPRIAP